MHLVTRDELLWQRVGQALLKGYSLHQADDLAALVPLLERYRVPSICLVDLHDGFDVSALLARIEELQTNAVLVLIEAPDEPMAPPPSARIVGRLPHDFEAKQLVEALGSADAALEIHRLRAQIVPPSRATEPPESPPWRAFLPWLLAAAAILTALPIAWYFAFGDAEDPAPRAVSDQQTVTGSAAERARAEEVARRVELARLAMLERRYLLPPEDNALLHYRAVLEIDARNREARSGLERLAEVLIARAESAFAERRFDEALQALEGARELVPDDSRIGALDAEVRSSRSISVVAQIQAAAAAGSHARALALLEEARRSGAAPAARLDALRAELLRQRDEAELARLLRAAESRLAQGQLAEPQGESARDFILQAARLDRARAASLQSRIATGLLDQARDQTGRRQFAQAQRSLAAARELGAPAAALTEAQRSLGAAHSEAAPARPDPPPLLGHAREQPADDSAVGPLPAARAPDPGSAELGASARGPELLPLAQLTAVRPIKVRYPERAADRGIEGWVDLEFTVEPNGEVSDIIVRGSQPRGVFDAAAVSGLSAARYRPTGREGQAAAHRSRVRIVFRNEESSQGRRRGAGEHR